MPLFTDVTEMLGEWREPWTVFVPPTSTAPTGAASTGVAPPPDVDWNQPDLPSPLDPMQKILGTLLTAPSWMEDIAWESPDDPMKKISEMLLVTPSWMEDTAWEKPPEEEVYEKISEMLLGKGAEEFKERYSLGEKETLSPLDISSLMGQFPSYKPYESPLLTEVGETIGRMLRGEGVGIPEESKQWQRAMGRITEAERRAEEAVTKLAARQGRMDSGLYAADQMRVVEQGLMERARAAEEFTIRSAEMVQEAKEKAISMGIGYAGFRAEEATKEQQAAQHMWNTMVQLHVLAQQQAYDWTKTLALWEEQRAQIELGAEVAAPGFWDYFSAVLGSFLGALGRKL